MMKAVVDKETCIGCGLCETLCSDVFRMGADNKAAVLVDVIPAPSAASANDAKDSCPVSAIMIE
jgi:ferredoxin